MQVLIGARLAHSPCKMQSYQQSSFFFSLSECGSARLEHQEPRSLLWGPSQNVPFGAILCSISERLAGWSMLVRLSGSQNTPDWSMLKVLLRVWLESSVTLVEELRMYPSWVKCISAYFLSFPDELWCCLGRCSRVERFGGRVRTSSSCAPHSHPTIFVVPMLFFGSQRLSTSCHWQDSTPLACGCWPVCCFALHIPCASAGSGLAEVCCLCCCSCPFLSCHVFQGIP